MEQQEKCQKCCENNVRNFMRNLLQRS